MSSPKVGLLEFIKSKFRHVSSFSRIGKKNVQSWTRGWRQIHEIFYRIFTECFTADILQFFTKKRQNLALGCTAG